MMRDEDEDRARSVRWGWWLAWLLIVVIALGAGWATWLDNAQRPAAALALTMAVVLGTLSAAVSLRNEAKKLVQAQPHEGHSGSSSTGQPR